MTTDLSKRLRELASAEHDDLSVASEAADLIDQQAAEIEMLKKKLVIKLDDYYGAPCEQIRHRQELDDMRSQRDEWRRRAERLLVLATKHCNKYHHDWCEITGAAQWFEEDKK